MRMRVTPSVFLSLSFSISESDGNHSTEDESSKGREDLSPCPLPGSADRMTSRASRSSRAPEFCPTEDDKNFLFNGAFHPSSSGFLSPTGSLLFGVPGLAVQLPDYRPKTGSTEDGDRPGDKETDRPEAVGSSDGDGLCEKRTVGSDGGDGGVSVISFFRDTEAEVNSRASGSGLQYDHVEKVQVTGYGLEDQATAGGGREGTLLMRDSLTLPHLQLPSSSSPAAPTQGERHTMRLHENNPQSHCSHPEHSHTSTAVYSA